MYTFFYILNTFQAKYNLVFKIVIMNANCHDALLVIIQSFDDMVCFIMIEILG